MRTQVTAQVVRSLRARFGEITLAEMAGWTRNNRKTSGRLQTRNQERRKDTFDEQWGKKKKELSMTRLKED